MHLTKKTFNNNTAIERKMQKLRKDKRPTEILDTRQRRGVRERKKAISI